MLGLHKGYWTKRAEKARKKGIIIIKRKQAREEEEKLSKKDRSQKGVNWIHKKKRKRVEYIHNRQHCKDINQ